MKQTHEITGTSQETFPLSIIQVSKDKKPFQKWDEYKTKLFPISNWHTHYRNKGSVGVIGGKISGNLEVIDVDVKNDPQSTIYEEFIKLIPQELFQRLIIQTTPNNGYHIIYRCKEVTIEGNQKLALHSDGKVIIETRGEGGYFCTSKDNNLVLQGQFDLEGLCVDIPLITQQERELLFETAQSLTRYFPILPKKDNKKESYYSEPAINQFNTDYNILDLFEKHHWSVTKQDDEKVYLLRPGTSFATHSGYYFKDTKTFFCFSTSTGFKAEKPHNHFQILKVLEGISDYKTSLRRLADLGFSTGQTTKKDKITSDDIADYLNERSVRYDNFIQDITLLGKPIEDIDLNTLYLNLKKDFDKELPRQRFEDVIKSRYITGINPIEDFIDNHQHRQPLGVFERWVEVIELMDKEMDKSAVVHFLKKWYVGMIAQTLDGPFPNEFFISLLSREQGIGKTTFLRNYVLPLELQKYVAEHSLSFDDDFKVIMGQSILIVDDEMDGRTYDSAQTFKSILSQKEMTTRRKYDRRISTIKRRCSFAGSGNQLNVIREAQNRRIIPIEVKSFDWDVLNQIDLEDLFMEAYTLYQSGFKYSYEHSDKEMLTQLYENYIQKSDVQLLLEEYVLKPTSSEEGVFIPVIDIVNKISREHPNQFKRLSAGSIGRTMTEMGFRTERKGTRRTTGYKIDPSSKLFELDFKGLITDFST